MTTPDARTAHNPDPLYLRELVDATGLTQLDVAQRLGISPRKLRYHLAEGTKMPAPYVVQYALEGLAAPVRGGARSGA